MQKFSLLGMCGLIALMTNCNKVAIQSFWNDGTIKIDAVTKDWDEHLIWNSRNKTGLGIANDADNLYLCLTSSDRSLYRQMIMRGFIVSIYQKGGKNHNFGIKFPRGIRDQNFQSIMPWKDLRNQIQFEPGQGGQENPQSGFIDQIDELQTELVLLGPGEEQEILVPLKNDLGLEVEIGHDRQQLVYELKIPFAVISRYLSIEQVSTSKPLAIHFKTTKIDMPLKRPDNMPGRPGGMNEPEGGMGGFGEGMAGPGGGMGGPGGGMDRPGHEDFSNQTFSYKISVTLAENQ